MSMLFTIPSLLHYCFTTMQYIEIVIGDDSILIPDAIVTNEVYASNQYFFKILIPDFSHDHYIHQYDS